MDTGLPHSIANRLNTALDSWREWQLDMDARPVFDRTLPGNTNDSVLLNLAPKLKGKESSPNKAVLRLNSARSQELGINREREYQILDQIREMPFSKTIYYQHEAFLVSEYIPGDNLRVEDLTLANLVIIAATLWDIHNTECSLSHRLVMAEELNRYYQFICKDWVEPSLSSLHSSMLAILPGSGKITLCHNDPLVENLFMVGRQVKLVDWEYANMGDPLFDLAVFTEKYQLTGSRLSAFLGGYGQRVSQERLQCQQLVYSYIELLWWLVREREITPPDHKQLDHEKIETLMQRVKQLIS